ncbi:MAG TPA: methyltransferase domain-containing protein [Jatrophihabitantaceae bacterium]|nr:methyltransferase domain-containing protein [Jatrophihabitantaceae bacterium]
MTTNGLALTGERTVPGVWHENYWFRRHEAAYEFLLPYAAVRSVLEVGCGEGYGTARFAEVADRVIGLDYDAAAVAHAAASYPTPSFLRANLAALPVRDAVIDVVATLQVIEHVWDHTQFVRECLRVLRPGGTLLVTTPNRLTFSPGRLTPINPYHTHEFTAAELSDLLTSCGFIDLDVQGLRAGSRLRNLDAGPGGSFADAQLAAPPEQWSDDLAQQVVGVTTADFVTTATDPDAALDLVVVARRPGV